MSDVITGRDLVMYILKNKLEDKPINDIWCLKSFITAKQAAVRYNVGEETIKAWFAMGRLNGIQIGKTIYVTPVTTEYIKGLTIPTVQQAHSAFVNRNQKHKL